MIVVTGATGHLGQLVVDSLLKKVPASQIAAAVRTPSKAQTLTNQGVQVREADYARPETLASAFAGAEKVLLISSTAFGDARIAQHKAAVDAAKVAGVKLLAYTSILHADQSTSLLAADHKATEALIKASGIPYIFLRNGWYFENQTVAAPAAVEHGALIGASGEGRFAAAARADYAEAAATVLATPITPNQALQLAGDSSYTRAELAAEIAGQSGKSVVYQNLSEADFAKALTGFGLPQVAANAIADAETSASHGMLDNSSHTLSTLIGHPTETLAEAVARALKR